MTERRAVPRHRTYFKGVLSFNNGNSSEDCLVRNLSEAGAQVELPHPRAPADFDLIVAGRDLRRPARAVWRSGGRVGVVFAGAAPARSPARAAPALDLAY